MEARKKTVAQEEFISQNSNELKLFVKGDPFVQTAHETPSVPAQSKKQFYSRFDTLARNLAADVAKEYLGLSNELLQHYEKVKDGLVRKTNIEFVSLPQSLDSFLKNPLQELTDGIQSYLFDFLQGRAHYEEFAQKASRNVRSRSRYLYGCGYDYWVFLNIVNMLDPVEVYGVEFGPDLNPVAINTTVLKPERQQPISERRIPDTVIKTKSGSLYAIKFEKAAEINNYEENFGGSSPMNHLGDDSWGVRGHYVMMIYRIPSLAKIPTVVNLEEGKVTLPNLAVEVSSEEALRAPTSRKVLGNRAATLNPEKAYYIVLPEDTPPRRWFRGDDRSGRKLPRMKYIPMLYQSERLETIVRALR